jgi:EF hand
MTRNEDVMKNLTMIGGVSALILIATAAMAAPTVGRAKTDADGNGTVTKAEAMSTADARFAKLDADGNGQIDKADRAARVKARFAKMDADGNGSVTEAEFIAANEARTNARQGRNGNSGEGRRVGKRVSNGGDVGKWGKADTNNDQAISRSEYNAATLARFSAKDKDSNGELSGDELKRGGKRGDGAGKRRDRGQEQG